MHAVVMESLEEYLSGTLKPAVLRDIEAHLSNCEMCRQEVVGMQQVSQWFGAFKAEEEVAPAPGFYGRVMRQVGHRQAVPSFAGFFALDFAFGRRLVFASLVTLAVLGSYLVAYERDYPTGLSPDTVMAQQDSPAYDNARAQENMLATMTTYGH
ncbi:MAG: zf-HC2 domain-containing protein [Candidatus Solibacter sp.]|nr:zf-HC2 domain-containing protein [Candidatus Solibacter sp.]